MQSQVSALADGSGLDEQDRAWVQQQVAREGGEVIRRIELQAQESRRQLDAVESLGKADVDMYVEENLNRRDILGHGFQTTIRTWAGEEYLAWEDVQIERIDQIEAFIERLNGGV